MEKTWRWFGKKDKITLPMLRQIGVEGVVTALHDVPNGEIWALEAIKSLTDYIESHQLRWFAARRRNDLAGAEGTGAFLRQQVLYVAVPDQRLCGAGHCPV